MWIYKGDILPYKPQTDDKVIREAAMAVGDASGLAGQPRKVVSSATRKKSDEPEIEAAPLLKEADPEIERLLAEEEEIERRIHESHETPHFRGNED